MKQGAVEVWMNEAHLRTIMADADGPNILNDVAFFMGIRQLYTQKVSAKCERKVGTMRAVFTENCFKYGVLTIVYIAVLYFVVLFLFIASLQAY